MFPFNRTLSELKHEKDVERYNHELDLQSHLIGIETYQPCPYSIIGFPFNRTLSELKPVSASVILEPCGTFNRTLSELKQIKMPISIPINEPSIAPYRN